MINVASVDPFPDHFHCTVETGRVFTYIIIPQKKDIVQLVLENMLICLFLKSLMRILTQLSCC